MVLRSVAFTERQVPERSCFVCASVVSVVVGALRTTGAGVSRRHLMLKQRPDRIALTPLPVARDVAAE
jgi:hypothetical protein